VESTLIGCNIYFAGFASQSRTMFDKTICPSGVCVRPDLQATELQQTTYEPHTSSVLFAKNLKCYDVAAARLTLRELSKATFISS